MFDMGQRRILLTRQPHSNIDFTDIFQGLFKYHGAKINRSVDARVIHSQDLLDLSELVTICPFKIDFNF